MPTATLWARRKQQRTYPRPCERTPPTQDPPPTTTANVDGIKPGPVKGMHKLLGGGTKDTVHFSHLVCPPLNLPGGNTQGTPHAPPTWTSSSFPLPPSMVSLSTTHREGTQASRHSMVCPCIPEGTGACGSQPPLPTVDHFQRKGLS